MGTELDIQKAISRAILDRADDAEVIDWLLGMVEQDEAYRKFVVRAFAQESIRRLAKNDEPILFPTGDRS